MNEIIENVKIAPTDIDMLIHVVKQSECCLAVGSQSKPRLSRGVHQLISMEHFSKLLQYDPSEFTFTSQAGISLRSLQQCLAERNQYLPFDPLFVDAGATLGGTIAAGISGPGCFRFGGIRDFILEVKFIDGNGRSITAGSKVVKNAAGFDIPKFLVGSLGRFGILTEVTMKVFPKPQSTTTLAISCNSPKKAIEVISFMASSHWELDAIDYLPIQNKVLCRIAGPELVNAAIAEQIKSRCCEHSIEACDDIHLAYFRDTNIVASKALMKVSMTSRAYLAIAESMASLESLATCLSAAANTLWIATDEYEQITKLNRLLNEHNLQGIVLRGDLHYLWLGARNATRIGIGIKHAFDPVGRFPSLDS